MVRTYVFVLVGMVCAGCGSDTPRPRAAETRYTAVNARELARLYLGNRNDPTFKNIPVQVKLGPRAYTVGKNLIEAHFANERCPGFLRFRCPAPPPDNSYALVVSGVCRGTVTDGVPREPDCDYYVLVDECSVTALPGTAP